MRNVLLLDGIIFDIQSGGGISVYFRELIAGLTEMDCSYSLLLGSSDTRNWAKHSSCIYYKRRIPLLIDRLLPISVPAGHNVFHSSYYRVPMNKFTGMNVVTVHDFIPERLFPNTLKSRVLARQKIKAMVAADYIIAISEFTKQEILDIYPQLSSKEIVVIHNGISEIFRQKREWSSDSQNYVLFVGSRAKYKNFELVVKSVSVIPSLQLVVVGGGDFRNDERGLITDYLPDRILHKKAVATEELASLYSGALALGYPSEMEGFGIPPIEAMASGCPAIVRDIPVTREICGPAAIYLDTSTVEEFVVALRRLEEGIGVADIVDKGYRWSRNYSWRETVEKTVAVYGQ